MPNETEEGKSNLGNLPRNWSNLEKCEEFLPYFVILRALKL
jgi:hypothetical protein